MYILNSRLLDLLVSMKGNLHLSKQCNIGFVSWTGLVLGPVGVAALRKRMAAANSCGAVPVKE